MQTIENEIRKERGKQIAQTMRILKRGKCGYVVPSQSGHGAYLVHYKKHKPVCECPDFEKRSAFGVVCKHCWAVELTINKEINADGTTTITKTMKVTYPQDWKNYDLASTNQKDIFQKLLFDLCRTIPELSKKATGRPSLSISDMVFTSALKVYTNFSLRRFMCDVREAHERGYINQVPHFTLPSKYMQKQEMTAILQDLITMSALPLKSVETSFSIDASGISPSRFSRWFDKKYNVIKDRKIWYKLHVVNGNATHIISSCEVTTQHVHDTLKLEELTKETHENFDMKEICADRGYLSQPNLEHLNRLGVAAYIPFKSNTIANNEKKSEIWRNAYNYFVFNQSAFLAKYHQRSNSETVFYMVKSKFGDSVRSKNDIACINEILLKVLCHNICVLISEMFELGIQPELFMQSCSTERGDFLQK